MMMNSGLKYCLDWLSSSSDFKCCLVVGFFSALFLMLLGLRYKLSGTQFLIVILIIACVFIICYIVSKVLDCLSKLSYNITKIVCFIVSKILDYFSKLSDNKTKVAIQTLKAAKGGESSLNPKKKDSSGYQSILNILKHIFTSFNFVKSCLSEEYLKFYHILVDWLKNLLNY